MEKAAKEKFTQELYQLDDDSDEEELSHASLVLNTSILSDANTTIAQYSEQEVAPSSMSRTMSDPLPKARSTPQDCNKPQSGLLFSSVIPSSVTEHFVLEERPPGSYKSEAMTKSNGKRKRSPPLEMKPEAQQLFKGLSFCLFIPSSELL